MDYEETYTPVTKITTVRILLVIITLQGWPLKQMDVKNVFLHGDLREGIYMTPPPSLFSSSTSEVCKLNRSLYGLKQTLRTWFEKFQLILLQFNFVQSQNDFFFFLYKTSTRIVLLLIYVDDIVITGTNSSLITQLQHHIRNSFHMKDLNQLTYFLRLEVHSNSFSIFLHQHKYTQDLISLADLQDSSLVDIMKMNVKYYTEKGNYFLIHLCIDN